MGGTIRPHHDPWGARKTPRLDRYRDDVETYRLDCENIARDNNLPTEEMRAQLGYYSRQYRFFFDMGAQYDGYRLMRLTDWSFY